MSQAQHHGRRRAAVEVPYISAPVLGSRRDALAAERKSAPARASLSTVVRGSLSNGASQKVGLALAVTGLALAVTVPSATPDTVAVAEVEQVSATAPLVTAAPDVALTFAAPALSTELNEEGQLQEVLKVEASNVTPQAAAGTLSAPLSSLSESSSFGLRINPLTGAPGEVHTGQDYAVACSTAVMAAAGGTVTFAGWHDFGGGNRVVVDHGNGLATSYNHLSTIGVKVGQVLARGEQLALSGTTGASTGCHLHFEVMVDDETVDPQGWL